MKKNLLLIVVSIGLIIGVAWFINSPRISTPKVDHRPSSDKSNIVSNEKPAAINRLGETLNYTTGELPAPLFKWSQGTNFKLSKNSSGRPIFIDPEGKEFYSIAMVYAYGPEKGEFSKKKSFEDVAEDLKLIKLHNYNTLDLYGDAYLEEMLTWCDENNLAVYLRTSYTDFEGISRERSEFPDFMDKDFRNNVKQHFDPLLNIVKNHPSFLAFDMDQRWLFELDWNGFKRFAVPRVGPSGIQYFPKYIEDKYSDIAKLNSLWGKSYITFSDILSDAEIINSGVFVDLDAKPWRVDVVEYTLWTINDFLSDLSVYIRTIAPHLLITYTTELPEVAPFPISTKENSGMDFISPVHYNNYADFGRDWISNAKLLFNLKFHYDLSGLPSYINETGFRTSPLDQNPPITNYAFVKKGDERHLAELYLRQVTAMQSYPWLCGWAYFMLYDKWPEGDFGYLRDDRSLKPISKLGLSINNKLPINFEMEKAPVLWVYYPSYALAAEKPGFTQFKSLIMFLENEFLNSYEQSMIRAEKLIDDPSKIVTEKILNRIPEDFNKNWVPFKFTSTIPNDDLPIILASDALMMLSTEDREILANKKTITFGKIGVYDDRFQKTTPWFLDVLNIKPQDESIINVTLDKNINDSLNIAEATGSNPDLASPSIPKSKSIFTCKNCNVNFEFPGVDSGALKNVKADGQKIDVEAGIYTSAHFLIASINGDIFTTIDLGFNDGSKETVNLGKTVGDFRAEPANGHSALEFDLTQYVDGLPVAGKAYLSDIEVNIGSDKILNSIILPKENDVHVFAITLVRNNENKDSSVTVKGQNGLIISGLSYWRASLDINEADYNILGSFSSGEPAIVQSKDGRHTAFLYDALSWLGAKNEISREAEKHSAIIKKLISTK